MALTTTALPYGIRDIKLKPLPAPYTTPGTSVDLPYARTRSFTEGEGDTQELRGDDVVVASRGAGIEGEWELESGGMPVDAGAVINGGTVTETGTTPNQVKTYTKKTTHNKPYFKAFGQIISESGGDVWGVLYKCRATEIEYEFAEGEFYVHNASGNMFGSNEVANLDTMYEIIQHETAAALT